MTANELLRLPRGRFRYELIRGELRTTSLTRVDVGAAATAIGCSLFEHVKAHRLGEVCINVGFQIERDPDTVLAADVAFIRSDRIVNTQKFFEGAPDLAIRILSDREERIADWLRAGTRAVIIVDPARRSVRIHRPSEIVDVADAIIVDDVVPGWRLPLAEIFE